MQGMRERGLFELYGDDPERADALVFGRRVGVGRRGFLKGAGLAAMGAAVGGVIPFAGNMPAGLIPAALAQQAPAAGKEPAKPPVLKIEGKAGLIVLEERPLNAETPAHLLDDEVTPTANMYIRNNGLPPEPPADPDKWELTVDGEVNAPLKLPLGELKKRFANVTYRMQLECGGNGRSFFVPEARGNQWGHGAVGQPEWTGVRLKDVLAAAGPKAGAVYTAHVGADLHLSGDPAKLTLSRGVRLEKAMEEHTLIAFAMNGRPLHVMHGFPLRLVVPGWAGSASQKWLTRIWLRDKEHDGPGMTGTSYRLTIVPMVPGAKHDPKNMRILESMPVRSLITNVADGSQLAAGTRQLALRGHAWAGEKTIRDVHVSVDYGQTWSKAETSPPANKYAWQTWKANVALPSHGYFELWSRATDSDGKMQPHVAPNWNPSGYGGNPFHRVAVLVAS
jgi:DMSO/TMAO reductase YedYZ molybdopterin-dependent catalytic subunit